MGRLARLIKMGCVTIATASVIACSGVPPKDLGYLTDGELRPCPSSPNCQLTRVTNPYGLEQGVSKLKASLSDSSGVLISEKAINEQSTYLHSEFSSSVMQFVDDVECVVSADEVIIRSASRLGYSDFGVNAKRVNEIISIFSSEADK